MAYRRGRASLLPGIVFCLTTGCLLTPSPPPRPLPPTPTPTRPVLEEDAPPPQRLEVEIRDFRATDAGEGSGITITGTIVNKGNRATSQVVAVVEALDAAGHAVVRRRATPDTEIIEPYGGTTGFRAEVEYRPEVVRYQVEVVAR